MTRLRRGMVAVSGMEVRDMTCGGIQRVVTHTPANVGDGTAGPATSSSRADWKNASGSSTPDARGPRQAECASGNLHQVLPSVAVVEACRPEEQGHGASMDGAARHPIVTRRRTGPNGVACSAGTEKLDRLIVAGARRERCEYAGLVRPEIDLSGDLRTSRRSPSGCPDAERYPWPARIQQIQHVLCRPGLASQDRSAARAARRDRIDG